VTRYDKFNLIFCFFCLNTIFKNAFVPLTHPKSNIFCQTGPIFLRKKDLFPRNIEIVICRVKSAQGLQNNRFQPDWDIAKFQNIFFKVL
jgi:hypothetical protein